MAADYTVRRVKGDSVLVRVLAELDEAGAEVVHLQALEPTIGIAQWVIVHRPAKPDEPLVDLKPRRLAKRGR